MNGQNRKDVSVGARVHIVLKADQRSGKLTVTMEHARIAACLASIHVGKIICP